MKPYQEMLEGGYRLIRIRNLKRIIFIFILVLALVGWAFIWWSNDAGLKPFYTPLDAVLPWLLVMLLAGIATSIALRDLEIKYAKREGQKYLMAKNSQRRAIWIIAIATMIAVIPIVLQTSGFISAELSVVRRGQIAAGETLFVADFSNQDFLGLTKVDQLKIANTGPLAGGFTAFVFKEGVKLAEQPIASGVSYSILIYNEGDALLMFNVTLRNTGTVPVDYEITAQVKLATALVLTIPIILVFFIGVSASWTIHLMPIRKKYATASIYSFDYAQELGKGEQVYSKYDARARPSEKPRKEGLPPPPDVAEGLPPPPPVPGSEMPAAAGEPAQPLPITPDQMKGIPPREAAKEFDVFIEDGSRLFTNGDYEGALKNFDSALALEPSNITAMLARGTVLTRLNREPEALDSFNKVLAVESGNENALRSKSRLLTDMKLWSEAVNTLDAYLRLRPADVEALGWKGDALMALGQRNDAALAYETALNLQPYDADLKMRLERARLDVASIMSRAMVSTASGSYDAALALYEEILQYEPYNSRALAGKAGVLRRLGRKEEAIESLDSVLAIEPENPGALLERARLHLEEGHLTEALDSAERLTKVNSTDIRGFILKAEALGEMDRFDEARATFRQALSIEKDSPEVKNKMDYLEARIDGIAQGQLSRELDEVKGIGPAKIKALYEAGFRTSGDLRTATAEQLSSVKGISLKLAEDILQHLKESEGENPPQSPPAPD